MEGTFLSCNMQPFSPAPIHKLIIDNQHTDPKHWQSLLCLFLPLKSEQQIVLLKSNMVQRFVQSKNIQSQKVVTKWTLWYSNV